jgi:hypothetical protein
MKYALIIVVMILTCLPRIAEAQTTYYLDPDWTGTKSGTQSQPFASINAQWSTINTALASGNVTIYLSARDAGSDTDDVLAESVDLTSKTANPTGTLILIGNQFYNTNDSTPSWSAYSGTSKSRVQSIDSQNAGHTKYSKVTIDGMHILQNSGSKGLTICGDNWTVQNSDIEHGSLGGSPLVLIVPTADAAHEGSSSYCPASSAITIQNNTIHNSVGELIYVGGAGCAINDANLSDTNCNGKPSHSGITISGNTMYGCGSWASQGDCIDMKGGLTNVTISRNNISNTLADNDNRAIVGQGIQTDGTNQNILIERNYIHDLGGVDDAAIAVVNSWGTPNGYTIRNNIIDTVTGRTAVHIYGTQSAGVELYNNTIYNAGGFCLSSVSGTITVKNNVCFSNNAGGAQVSLSGTITSTHNAYGGTWSAACTSCVSGVTSAAFTNAAGGDFSIPTTSALKDVGTTIATFANDYAGTSRPQGAAWDIGAYEYGGGSSSGGSMDVKVPDAPTMFVVQK